MMILTSIFIIFPTLFANGLQCRVVFIKRDVSKTLQARNAVGLHILENTLCIKITPPPIVILLYLKICPYLPSPVINDHPKLLIFL